MTVSANAHVTFARTCQSVKGIVAFANKYGLLGCAERSSRFSKILVGGNDVGGWTAETIVEWKAHSKAMRWHLDCWDALRAPRYGSLAKLAPRLLREGAILVEPPEGYPIAPLSETPPLRTKALIHVLGEDVSDLWVKWKNVSEAKSTRMRNQSMRELGWTALGLSVTARIRNAGVAPALGPIWTPDSHRERAPSGAPMAMTLTAHNLLGGLWLQLALAISQRVTYRRCLGCGDFLTIHPNAYRTNRRTCSDRCRSQIYRDNKGVARVPISPRRRKK